MKKLEEYLESIQKNECGSSAAGLGFRIDSPKGLALKTPYPKRKPYIAVLPDDKKKRNKKRKILIDEQIDKTRHHVLIDFDGVVCSYDGSWNSGEINGKLIENVKEAINEIHNNYDNVDIIIFTTRACPSENHDHIDQIKKLKEFFKENEIYYDDITGEKLPALIYIDDNGYRFSGNWKKDLPQIKKIIDKRINERESRKNK